MPKILLHVSGNFDAAQSEISRFHGRVIHRLSPDVIVAEMTEGFDPRQLNDSTLVSDQTIHAASTGSIEHMKSAMRASGSVAAQLADNADEATQLALATWQHYEAEAHKPSLSEGLSWDAAGHEAPKNDIPPEATPSLKE